MLDIITKTDMCIMLPESGGYVSGSDNSHDGLVLKSVTVTNNK